MPSGFLGEKEIREVPSHIKKLVDEKVYDGRMNAPSASARIKGICGDEIEFYLVIEKDEIRKVTFHTDGCIYTVFCAALTAHLAKNKTIKEALEISAGNVMNELKCLPKDHRHCAILAVSTLYRAIADYWLCP